MIGRHHVGNVDLAEFIYRQLPRIAGARAAGSVPNVVSRVINRLFEVPYSSLCRRYAKLSMPRDEPADGLMRFLIGLEFLKVHHYWPNFKNPRSFEEKLSCRMLFDRNPLWTQISDKLKAREYVAARVDRDYLIPLLWTGDDPAQIPYEELPSQFVIKTNHACGFNIFVKCKARLAQPEVERQLRNWLWKNYGTDSSHGVAWAYKNIRPSIMIEAFLGDEGTPPTDYKFFCFSGHPELLQLNIDRFGDPFEKTLTVDFRPLDIWQGTRQYPYELKRPDHYDEMVRIAGKLSAGLDFVRVDLYNVGGRVFVGELTCYPGGGYIRWIPGEFDFILGSRWRLETYSRPV